MNTLNDFQKRLEQLNSNVAKSYTNKSLYVENINNSKARKLIKKCFFDILNIKNIEKKKDLKSFVNKKLTELKILQKDVNIDDFLNKKPSKIYKNELDLIKIILK